MARHLKDPACVSCHKLMDPIGVGFGRYNGAGIWQELENGKPTTDQGEVLFAEIEPPGFKGIPELAQKLSESKAVQQCVSKQWFRYAMGRAIVNADECTIDSLFNSFSASGFRLKDLILSLTQTDAFLYRAVEPNRPVEPTQPMECAP